MPVIAHDSEITYNLSIFSLDQLQRSSRSREAVARFVLLSSDLTWDDVFGMLKIKISDVLFPGQAVVNEGTFEIFFSIPRFVPAPLPLVTEDDYKHLLRNVLKLRKDPAVKITVNQLVLVCSVHYIHVAYTEELFQSDQSQRADKENNTIGKAQNDTETSKGKKPKKLRVSSFF